MESKEFEDKLDKYAEKLSSVVSDGITRMETLYDQTKENLKSDKPATEKIKGLGEHPKIGHILIGLGIVWFLFTLHVFDNWIFPVLLIVLGVVIVLRKK